MVKDPGDPPPEHDTRFAHPRRLSFCFTDNALGRIYRDVLGRANQTLARAADEVIFMVAGLAMWVKQPTVNK